jgi:hypothetical protein
MNVLRKIPDYSKMGIQDCAYTRAVLCWKNMEEGA